IFTHLPLAVQQGAQEIRRVSALHFGIASPPDPARNRPAVHALFVAHDSVADGVVEPRLSTLLVFHTASPPPNNDLKLTSADGSGPLPGPARGLVEGNFLPTSVAADRGLSAAHDLAVATPGSTTPPTLATGVVLLANDGFGGITLSLTMQDDHIVPETLTRIPAPPGQVESLAYLTDDGHLSIWRPDESLPVPQSPTFVSTFDLRQLASSPELQTAAVDP